jgi:hypothetical protein
MVWRGRCVDERLCLTSYTGSGGGSGSGVSSASMGMDVNVTEPVTSMTHGSVMVNLTCGSFREGG